MDSEIKVLKKALIVEDDVSTQRLILHILENSEFHCRTADSGLEAIEVIKDFYPDIIILDISMPEMSGEDFFLWLKSDSLYTFIPVIFLTAISSPEKITQLLDLGAEDYMIKPFDSNVLLARIRKALRSSIGIDKAKAGILENSGTPEETGGACSSLPENQIKKVEYMGLIWQARQAGNKIFVSSVPLCPECGIEFSVSKEWAGFLKKKYWYCKKCKRKNTFSSRRLSEIYATVRHEFEKSLHQNKN